VIVKKATFWEMETSWEYFRANNWSRRRR